MAKEYQALIIDDERPARLMLRNLLEKYQSLIRIEGEAQSGKDAITLIEKIRPDLLFLDIRGCPT